MWLLLGLMARADSGIDVDALIASMDEAVGEVELLRRGAEGDPEVARCIDERLVSMRALVELAGRAHAVSSEADSEGKADLEARKVMVAASRQESLRVQAHLCRPDTEVVLDCPECPTDAGITEAPEEELVVGPMVPEEDEEDTVPEIDTGETDPGSPFE